MSLVRDRPGLPLSELRRRAGMGWGVFDHHLQRLEREGLVQTVRAGRFRLVYPAGFPTDEDGALLNTPTTRRIALAILARPGISIRVMARDLGLSDRIVYYHVNRLVAAGLVRSTSQFHYRGLSGTGRLAGLLGV